MQAELMGVSSTPQDLLLEILTSQMHLRRMHLLLFASCIRPLRVIPGKGGGGKLPLLRLHLFLTFKPSLLFPYLPITYLGASTPHPALSASGVAAVP